MTKKTTSLAALTLLLALTVAGLCAGLFLFIRDASLPPPATLPKLDAIVVLTGGSNRVDSGFNLLEQGLGKKLFISGVYRGTEVKQLLKRWKDEPQSSLDCCVVLGFEADNTAENAIETVEWLKKEGYTSFYLVTANYHIQRALLKFREIDPGLSIIPFPIAPEQVKMNAWWRDAVTRRLILREYMKYAATWVWHWLKKIS